MAGILKGIRILDMSRLLPGPFCTQMLGDLGADVIKIEEISEGDYIRDYPPKAKFQGALYLALNRNKRSIKLDLRSDEGKEIFFKMVSTADVIVEQFRPGVMNRLGLGYEQLQKVNPGIIVCAISGYGQTGSYREKAGHDINYLSITGILDLIGNCQGSPVIPGIQVADVGGGSLWAAFSILLALFAREKTDKGQYIDVSMLDAVFTFAAMQAGAFFIDNKVPRRAEGLLNGGYAWYNVYKTADDRYIALGMLETKFWAKFCRAIGREEYIAKQFANASVQRKLMEELQNLFITKDSQQWMELLEPLDICITLVNNMAEAVNDPHLRERGMIIEIDDPTEGKFNALGFPVKFSDISCTLRLPPPGFGQHSEDILRELGYSTEQIGQLKSKNII